MDGETAAMQSPLHRRAIVLACAALAAIAATDVLIWPATGGLGLALTALLPMALGLLRAGRAIGASVVVGLTAALGLVIEPGPLGLPIACLAGIALALSTSRFAEVLGRLSGMIVMLIPGRCRDALLLVRGGAIGQGAGHVRRWMIPGAIALVFLGLFTIANPVLWLRIEALWEWLWRIDLPPATRAALWVLAAGIACLCLRPRGFAPRAPAETRRPPAASDAAPVVRSLLAANAVFALHLIHDACYLTGGLGLPEGMTYAGYAHRGAYPLIATALLAGGFILVWFRPGSAAAGDRLARRLLVVWVGQNLLLLAATAWRLDLYIDVYGLTRWRLATLWWLLLVAIGLGCTTWRNLRSLGNAWLVEACARAGLAVLLIAAALPWAPTIAGWNVRHCREAGGPGPPLDWEYLADLGPTVRPAAAWLGVHAQAPADRARAAALAQDAMRSLSASGWRAWSVTAWWAQHERH
jgi:hypothetical protein